MTTPTLVIDPLSKATYDKLVEDMRAVDWAGSPARSAEQARAINGKALAVAKRAIDEELWNVGSVPIFQPHTGLPYNVGGLFETVTITKLEYDRLRTHERAVELFQVIAERSLYGLDRLHGQWMESLGAILDLRDMRESRL